MVATSILLIMSGLTPSLKLFLSSVPPPSFAVQVHGLLGMVLVSSTLGMTCGTIILFKFLYPTIALQNSGFFLFSEEKSGVLTLDN